MIADFDYVIVGAGAAGCALAARLSEDSDVSVALIEAGGKGRSLLIDIPGANVVTGAHPLFNWSYETEPVPALDHRRLFWAQGRALGGSSAINGMMYLRGRPHDYDGWAAMGCVGWAYADVLPYFRKSEANERGADALHGADGPLQVSRGRGAAPICDLFLDAMRVSGVPVVDDLCADLPEACGHVDQTLARGRRSSAASAYLAPARRRRNLTIFTRTRALRVAIEKGTAVGVVCAHGKEERVIRAERDVVLCGGATNSPQLLMLSGVGPADELQAAGLTPRVDLPGVGRNLQNHPMLKLVYGCSAPVTSYSHVQPLGALAAVARYLLWREGPLSRGVFPTAGWLRADRDLPETEVQFCMAPAPVMRRGPGVRGILPDRHGFTVLANLARPFSRGAVGLRSADPLAAPAIRPDFFSDPRDFDTLAAGVERLRSMILDGPLKDVVDAELQPLGPIANRDDLIREIRANAATHYHPVGTCRMGGDDGAVVDPQLRVRGVDRLRVVDASVMPVIPSANTYAPTLMVAERAADLMKAA